MKYRIFRQPAYLTGFVMVSVLTVFNVGAQTPPPKKAASTPPGKKVATATPKKVAAAKPAPAPKTVTPPPAAKAATSTAVNATTSMASPVVVNSAPNASTVPPAVSTALPTTISSATSSATTQAAVAQSLPVTGSTTRSASPGDPRAPVAGQGMGTFIWPGGWTLTAYGCFRAGTRLFCDFDTTNQNNMQANNTIWSVAGGVNLVDDGGKITHRHNAFFVGTDGSQFSTAYISPQPVRFIIEYDDVDQRYTAISLILGRDRIPGIPITVIDPSQQTGTIPARAAVSATAPAAGMEGASSAPTAGNLDKANQAVNTATQQKKKAHDFWKSVQTAIQSH